MKPITSPLERIQKIALGAGILFLILSVLGWLGNRQHFFVSYLFAFLFWAGLSFGCFNAALMLYLTGGRWGNGTRRFLEAGFMNLPLVALMFIPLLFGLRELYPWARPELVAVDRILRQRAGYENVIAFILRGVFFFTLWIGLAIVLRKWSLRQDHTTDPGPSVKMRTLSGPAMVIVPLTLTFALVDWVLSLETAWFSTIFALILMAGQILIAFAFITVLLAWLGSREPFVMLVTEKDFLDLGNLLLAFVMFWTYVSFSQLLIVYSGNQPAEIDWYLHRIAGGWKWLISLVALFHFLVPFLLLLFRPIKQSIRRLATVAGLIFLANALEIYWTIAPTFYPSGFQIHWTDFTVWLGLGGIWLGIFMMNLKRYPLVIQRVWLPEDSPVSTTNAK
jgi:hypothetical protein